MKLLSEQEYQALQDRINELEQPTPQLIDYGRSDSFLEPFDGEYVYGILPDSQHMFRVRWVPDEGQWRSKEGGRYKPVWFTHWMPVPAYMKGGQT